MGSHGTAVPCSRGNFLPLLRNRRSTELHKLACHAWDAVLHTWLGCCRWAQQRLLCGSFLRRASGHSVPSILLGNLPQPNRASLIPISSGAAVYSCSYRTHKHNAFHMMDLSLDTATRVCTCHEICIRERSVYSCKYHTPKHITLPMIYFYSCINSPDDTSNSVEMRAGDVYIPGSSHAKCENK